MGISLKEVDASSGQLLQSFKEFVDEHYGSVKLCFESLDKDGNGILTLSELRRACKKLRWRGEVRVLFKCLDKDGGASVSMDEISFLDSWEPVLEEPDSKQDGIPISPSAGSPATDTSARLRERLQDLAKPTNHTRPSQVQSPPKQDTSQVSLPPVQEGACAGSAAARSMVRSASHPSRGSVGKPPSEAVKKLCETFKCPELAFMPSPKPWGADLRSGPSAGAGRRPKHKNPGAQKEPVKLPWLPEKGARGSLSSNQLTVFRSTEEECLALQFEPGGSKKPAKTQFLPLLLTPTLMAA